MVTTHQCYDMNILMDRARQAKTVKRQLRGRLPSLLEKPLDIVNHDKLESWPSHTLDMRSNTEDQLHCSGNL